MCDYFFTALYSIYDLMRHCKLFFSSLFLSLSMHQLKGFEFIKGVILEPNPFDMERELVTATMKKRRNNMLKYYQVI